MYERQHLQILKTRMAEPRRRIQIIMGPRQVGKSKLVDQFVQGIDIPYDLHAADNIGRFEESWIPNIWQQARMKMDIRAEQEHILIIDEVCI
jgi:predicted AAA+ superfamily ATPase